MLPALRCRDRAGFVESPELLGLVLAAAVLIHERAVSIPFATWFQLHGLLVAPL
ncbi:hypothetical protein XOCgx_4057 [Xanthomonas oryzae pv. oryzicola]|nr:hypothetical protein XOCgx_4057 [Xanthomonas oryzae pv. oryzicola]